MSLKQVSRFAVSVVICGGGLLIAQDTVNMLRAEPPQRMNDLRLPLFRTDKGLIGSEIRMQKQEFSGKIQKPVGKLPAGLEGSITMKEPKAPDGLGYTDTITIDTAFAAEFVDTLQGGHLAKNMHSNGASFAASDSRAQLANPQNGAILPPIQTFSWTKGTSVQEYYLWIGSCFHCADLVEESEGLNLSKTANLPNDGRNIYLTLFSYIGGKWLYLDYQFYSLAGAVPSYLSSPTNGAALDSPQTFTWTTGVNVSDHLLWVGSCQDCTDILYEYQGSTTSRSVTLPLDGRTIFVSLFSNIQGRWYNYDYQFRAGVGNPVHVLITNKLGYSVNVFVNGSSVGSVDAYRTQYADVTVASMLVSFELIRPTLAGNSLGDTMAGYFNRIDAASGTYNFVVTNRIGTDWFFLPEITNRTGSALLMEVNGGLQAENKCNCEAPAYSTNVAAGYYRFFSNSNVRMYLPSSNYTGRYIFWGEDSNGVFSPGGALYPYLGAESGVLYLSANSLP